MKKITWRDKRCPKCGSKIDAAETCRKCGRPWTEELEKDDKGVIVESAIGLELGKQYDSIRKVGSHQPRQSRSTKNKEKLAGKKSVGFTEALPPQFGMWEIKDSDSELEIYRKRSLMRLDSRKIYNAMGLSVRAHDSTKLALLWLTRLWEFLDEAEQVALAPTLDRLKKAHEMLVLARQSKIAQATKMEKAMEKAYGQARKARVKTIEQQKKQASKMPPPGEDSEGLGLNPVAIDPALLMEEAKEKILESEVVKSNRRRKSDSE